MFTISTNNVASLITINTMKKLYPHFLTLIALCAFTVAAQAQCANDRYKEIIFSDFDLTSDVTYGSNVQWTGGSSTSLELDVRMPSGDTETNRPVIFFGHGGSFIAGDKTGDDIVPLAEHFAKMGYVTVCYEYRLGMNTLPPDSVSATEAVIRSYHDLKAAIRFMRADVANNGNTYGIDSSMFFVTGSSAGGFTALHLAYLDEVSEMPSYVDYNQPGLGGGLEGESGNLGHSSEVTAIISLCGALKDTAWMHNGDTPVLSLHAVDDDVVPYGQDFVAPFFNIPILLVNGSMPVHARADEVGIINCFKTYLNPPAANTHVPHAFDPIQYDTTIVYMRNWLQHFVCGDPLVCDYTTSPLTGVDEVITDGVQLLVYPNPSTADITLDLSMFDSKSMNVTLTDATGRVVRDFTEVSSDKLVIERDGLSGGLYFLNVSYENAKYSTKVIFK
jgi:para-nitrobenzyl esterase